MKAVSRTEMKLREILAITKARTGWTSEKISLFIGKGASYLSVMQSKGKLSRMPVDAAAALAAVAGMEITFTERSK